MKRRRVIIGCAVGLAAAAVAASYIWRGTPTSSAAHDKTITVAQWGQEKYLIYLPLYIAQSKGYFDALGLEVKLTFSGNDDQVFATVARGDAQFGIGDPAFAAISRDRGGDGVVIGQLVSKVSLWGIAKAGQPARKTAGDFAGARIGTFPRPSTAYTLTKDMIDQNKLSGARVVEVPIGSEAALLESGAADVVMMLEPAASLAVAHGYELTASFPTLWGPFTFTGITSTASYASSHADAIRKMRNAIQQALDLIHKSPDEASRIAAQLFPSLPTDVVKQAVTRMASEETIPTNVAVSTDGWNAVIRVRKEMGALNSAGSYSTVVWP